MRSWRWAACTSSGPSAMKRGGLTTSFEGAPVGKATRAVPASICPWKTTCCASLRASGSAASCKKLGMEEGVPIESRLITKRIAAAQKAVEGQNFEARKHLLEYDDVMNRQRTAVYNLRRQLLESKDQKEYILGIAEDVAKEHVETHCAKDIHPDEWDLKGLRNGFFTQFGLDLRAEGVDPTQLNHDELTSALIEKLRRKYDEKEALLTPDVMRWHEQMILLQVVDSQWKNHLLSMDDLKEGIGPARLRTEGPAGRVQERILPDVSGHDEPHR